MNPYQAYVEGGKWRCKDSPTGAHHWILTSHHNGASAGQCKWCLRKRLHTGGAATTEAARKLHLQDGPMDGDAYHLEDG